MKKEIGVEHLDQHTRNLKQELATGRQIQESLLPECCPLIPGWELAVAYRPAQEVGGDLYDFFPLPLAPNCLGLVIGDVTGKGISAALFMILSRTALRAVATLGDHCSPAVALKRANTFIVEDIKPRTRLFLSAFYAVMDTSTGRLTYANGGHAQPLLLHASTGRTEFLKGDGMILGAFSDIDPEERQVDMSPGDVLVLYTDGVTEARNREGAMFDDERLQDILKANPGANAQQIVDVIVNSARSFCGQTPQSDDITLLVIRRQPEQLANLGSTVHAQLSPSSFKIVPERTS